MGTNNRKSRLRQDADDDSHAVDVEPAARQGLDGDARLDRWRDFIFKFTLIVLAGLWIYSPTYHGDWLWDDDQLLTQNLTVQHRVSPDGRVPENSLASLAKLWLSPDGADYFPLSYTALWAQWPFFNVSVMQPDGTVAKFAWPTGYHVVTILCHIIGALLFWRLLHIMRLPGAWLGGMLFLVHPVCVETVGWVSEVKNTLSQPLFLLACASFVQFDDSANPTQANRHYALALIFFLLAMLAKTAIVMFPFVILVYGWWKHGFPVGGAGFKALLLAGASLALTVVPEMFWLVNLRSGSSSWPLFLGCNAIALLGPITSVVLAMGLLRGATPSSSDGSAGRGEKTLEKYVLYALPYFWISAVLGIATCYFQWSRAIGQEAIPVGGAASRIATVGMATLFYLWTTIWPFNLLTIYPRWEVDPPKLWQFLPWPILIAAGWWLWTHRGTAERPTWQRHAIFALAFFLLMLLPIIGIITISYMRITWVADHFLYMPMLSVLGLGAAAVASWFAKSKPSEQPVALAIGAILLAILGYSSFRYAHVWANEEVLWPHTIAGHPNPCHEGCGCWQAHNRLGAKKFARGDVNGAHFHFQNSTRLRPDLGETHNNLGTTLSARAQMFSRQGDQAAARREMDAAIEQFAEACRVTPHVPTIKLNLGNALAGAGRFGEAADIYKELLEREPNNPALLNNYGVSLYKHGKKEESIVQFRRALEIAPNLKDARESLAVALGEKPDPDANQPKPPPSGGQLQLGSPPPSATLGPAALP
jgi:Flp pilus assembly protein TadD